MTKNPETTRLFRGKPFFHVCHVGLCPFSIQIKVIENWRTTRKVEFLVCSFSVCSTNVFINIWDSIRHGPSAWFRTGKVESVAGHRLKVCRFFRGSRVGLSVFDEVQRHSQSQSGKSSGLKKMFAHGVKARWGPKRDMKKQGHIFIRGDTNGEIGSTQTPYRKKGLEVGTG